MRSSASIRSKLSLGIGAAVLGAYVTYGDELKNWIAEQEFPAPVASIATTGVDAIGLAATGAAFGMMFGPQGALAGAAIGFAVGIGMSLIDWLKKSRESAIERQKAQFEDKLAEMENISERISNGEDVPDADWESVSHVLSESQRRSRLALSSTDLEEANRIAAESRELLMRKPNLTNGGFDLSTLDSRVNAVLEGDNSAMSALMMFAEEREAERGSISRWMTDSDEWKENFLKQMIRRNMDDFSLERWDKWDEKIDVAMSGSRINSDDIGMLMSNRSSGVANVSGSVPRYGPLLDMLEKTATQSSLNVINNSPVNFAPVINNVSPTNINTTNSNSVFGGNGDNPTALPGGVN